MIFRKHILFMVLLLFPVFVGAAEIGISNTTDGIVLKNKYVSILLSRDAKLESFVDLRTNTDCAKNNSEKVVYEQKKDGSLIEASSLFLDEDCLVAILGGEKVIIRIQAYDEFFTAEVISDNLKEIDALTFLDLKTGQNSTPDDECLSVVGLALSLQTNPVLPPSIDGTNAIGRCYSHTGFGGSKIAIIACPPSELWRICRNIYHSIPPNSVPVAFASGGPFAHRLNSNGDDCVIVGDGKIIPKNIDELVDFYSSIGVRQVNIFMGHSTFLQGQFSFPNYGDAKTFKEQITDPLYATGIISTLHSFSFYISYNSNELLSDPKWQRQLEIRSVFSLSTDISSDKTVFQVNGDIASLKNAGSFDSFYSPYLLIDNEIIGYTVDNFGGVTYRRGQCGTKAASHLKGAKVKIIGGYYSCIAPQIGSELFYEVARRTAKAYNDGGFRGFYFDALDGLRVHLNNSGLNDYQWYYAATFINEVFKYCESDPLVVEFSQNYPSIWSARGRGECWDTPCRGYKNFIDDHTNRNLSLKKRNYVSTLGWYSFYQTRAKQPGNYSTKYMFLDDVDYLGAKAIAYDQTMVYNGLDKSDVDKTPSLQRNLNRYIQYNKLRTEGYFTESVKDILRKGQYEYKLAFRNRSWGFNEAVYCKAKIRDISKDVFRGDNPFKTQRPFIRLENLYSSNCSSSINLLKFDETLDFEGQKKSNVFSVPIDLSNNLAIKISLKGNGMDSKDGLCIRLRSLDGYGYADYVVSLNFEGWRDIILTNQDNGEYGEFTFKGMNDDHYQVHRANVDFSKINHIQVFKSGECSGVKVKSIAAVPIVDSPLVRPNAQIGKASVIFDDIIQSGEYIEYNAGEKTALVYDRHGNCRDIKVKKSRRFVVPKGKFSIKVNGENEHKNAPSEVALTIGLYGDFIHN